MAVPYKGMQPPSVMRIATDASGRGPIFCVTGNGEVTPGNCAEPEATSAARMDVGDIGEPLAILCAD